MSRITVRPVRVVLTALLALFLIAAPGVANAARDTSGVFRVSSITQIAFDAGDVMIVPPSTPTWVEGKGTMPWSQARLHINVTKRGSVVATTTCRWYTAHACSAEVTRVSITRA